MALTPGTKLGPYEIQSPLGAGGMGEVYLAIQSSLGRQVAIKVLPAEKVADPQRKQRFVQEAKSASSLNHPNIITIYDIGQAEGVDFISMELVSGKALDRLILRHGMRLNDALKYAIQIADALARAHAAGIVHRDLKPGNIMVNEDGLVKVLDFGLAKLTEPTPAGGDESTRTMRSTTGEGTIVGTIAYMSPEQAEGKKVDARSDIFSFGSVFYEMVTGSQPFHGDTKASTLAAILKDNPRPARQLVDGLPGEVEKLISRCLRKEVNQRCQHMDDVKIVLEELKEESDSGVLAAAAVAKTKPRRRLTWALSVAAALVLATVGVWLVRLRPQQPDYRQLTFRNGDLTAARFASDGQTIIYAAAWGRPEIKLYSSRVDGTEQRDLDLPPSELLAVSRSGELAIIIETRRFSSTGRLARVPLSGGTPRELLDHVISADWSPDGAQLAVARLENGKCHLEYPIGKPLYETNGWISDMRFSPQADVIAFMEHPLPGDDRGAVIMVDLKGSKRTVTREWNGEQGLAWSNDGSEVWFTATDGLDYERALYAVSRSGKKRLILRTPGGVYLEDIASDGRVLLTRHERRYEVAVSQLGGQTRQLSWLQIMVAASVSRDGQYAVIGDWGSSTDYNVYLAKLDGSPAVMLGSGVAGDISADNKWVTSILPSDTTKVLLLPTGIGETKTITAPNFHYLSGTWASDGHTLVVRASESDRPPRFWVQDIAGGSPRAVTPEGVGSLFVTVNHRDYISARHPTGTLRLYPIDGGEPKTVVGVSDTDEVIGGSLNADILYLTPNTSAIPLEIVKLNIATGRRQPFVSVSPADAAGVQALSQPIFTADEKRYVYGQVRELSVLYVAAGLK